MPGPGSQLRRRDDRTAGAVTRIDVVEQTPFGALKTIVFGASGTTKKKTKTQGEERWTKRSKQSGEFMAQKRKGKFKGVRQER